MLNKLECKEVFSSSGIKQSYVTVALFSDSTYSSTFSAEATRNKALRKTMKATPLSQHIHSEQPIAQGLPEAAPIGLVIKSTAASE